MGMFFKSSVDYGWSIDDILINGRTKTNFADLQQVINLDRSNSILAVDLKQLQQNIQTLPWVQKAEIKRSFFPNLLQIKLTEKDVLALWQYGNKFYPVDTNGNIVTVGAGSCDVVAYSSSGTVEDHCTIYSIAMSHTDLKMEQYDTFNLYVDGAPRKVSWRTSNPRIASVTQNGVVTGRMPGECSGESTILRMR